MILSGKHQTVDQFPNTTSKNGGKKYTGHFFFSVNTQTHTHISQEAESSKVTGNLAEDKQALKTARANLCDKGLDGNPSCLLKHQHLQYLPVLGIGYSPTLNERAPFPWQAEGRGPQDAKERALL